MTPTAAPAPREAYGLEAEIERLHHSIDSLAGAVNGLHEDVERQAEKLDQVNARQTSEFKALLEKVHDNYKELVGLQQDSFKNFGDRLDKMLSKQDEQAAAIRSEMRTDFSRIVDRQDSHFRWLFGLILASAVTVGLAIYKMH